MSGVVAGAIVGVAILGTQLIVEDQRITAEHLREDNRRNSATRLENLRFVRGLSSPERLDRPFRGLDLSGLDLAGLDLAYADFEGADLSDADLRGTNLVGANLDHTNLTGAVLAEANLRGATIFEPRDASETDFSETNLSGASIGTLEPVEPGEPRPFLHANFDGANLLGANMANVDFSSTEYLKSASIPGALFSGMDLSNVRMEDDCGADLPPSAFALFERLRPQTLEERLREELSLLTGQDPHPTESPSELEDTLGQLQPTESPLELEDTFRQQQQLQQLREAYRASLPCADDEYLYCSDATTPPNVPSNTRPNGVEEECLDLHRHIQGEPGRGQRVSDTDPPDDLVTLILY